VRKNEHPVHKIEHPVRHEFEHLVRPASVLFLSIFSCEKTIKKRTGTTSTGVH
jgi:hypothetical protein